ncbi:hypothetical protein F4825DRAFT_450624 [Nemania diffusa]|nr:hypothetical protein F4825DRAFT_450624 [Nemania diffusa]
MAQQGGTYSPSARAVSVPTRSTSSSKLQYQDSGPKNKETPAIEGRVDDTLETSSDPRHQLDTQSDDQQWAIVPRPGDDSGDGSHNQEASSHFDITLGWGRYKVTVFSWDMSIRRQANDCP